MLIADARCSAIRDFCDGLRKGRVVCREVFGLLEWLVVPGDKIEAALRCVRIFIAFALFSAIRDFWLGVRGGGLGCWEGLGALMSMLLFVFWEEGASLVAGACVDGGGF